MKSCASQQSVLVVLEGNSILGYIQRGVSSREEEVSVPFLLLLNLVYLGEGSGRPFYSLPVLEVSLRAGKGPTFYVT